MSTKEQEPKIIRHATICAVAAKNLNQTPDVVDKCVRGYYDAMKDLVKKEKPTDFNQSLFVSTPMCGFKIFKTKSGIGTDAEGNKVKLADRWTMKVAPPENFVKDVLNFGVEVILEVLNKKEDSKKAA